MADLRAHDQAIRATAQRNNHAGRMGIVLPAGLTDEGWSVSRRVIGPRLEWRARSRPMESAAIVNYRIAKIEGSLSSPRVPPRRPCVARAGTIIGRVRCTTQVCCAARALYSQPRSSAMRTASARLRAPTLAMAADK
jgi:hypothetical protein